MKTKRPIQKLLALVLCLAMLSTLIVFNVSAETDPIAISTPEELKQILTNPSGNYVLANNIIFEDDGETANWNPTVTFTGVLDGNGYSIYNLRVIVSKSGGYVGGLLYATSNATIKNISVYGTFDVTSTGTQTTVGTFASQTSGTTTIENCNSYLDITVTGSGAVVGGIVGEAIGSTKIDGCIYDGTITVDCTSTSILGGVVGWAAKSGSVEILNCVNYGDLHDQKGTQDNWNCLTGGIVGRSLGKCTITGCVNFGMLESCGYGIGGIMGGRVNASELATVSYCSNLGSIKAEARADSNYSQFVGGIFGWAYDYAGTVTYCYSIDDITSEHVGAKVGGLFGGYGVGYKKNTSFTNCVSDFDVMAGMADNVAVTNCVGTTDLDVALATLNGGDNQNAFRESWRNEGTIEPIYYLTAAKISVVGAQIRKNANDYDVRFVSAVSSLEFDAVGYQITVTGTGVNKTTMTPDSGSTVVYSAIYETVQGNDQRVDAPYGCAFYTETITGISYNDYDELIFTVIPFVIENGGEPQFQEAVTFVFNDGVLK